MKSVAMAVGVAEVLDVLRPSAALASLLEVVWGAAVAAGREPAGIRAQKATKRGGEELLLLFTRAEIVYAIGEYVRFRGLTDPADATCVVPDEALVGALFSKSKMESRSGCTKTISKQEIALQALKQCAPWHIVRCADSVVAHAGAVEPIEVVVKDLQGGKKHMTFVRNCEVCGSATCAAVVTALQRFGIDAAEFAREASKLYSCSASTQPSEEHAELEVRCVAMQRTLLAATTMCRTGCTNSR